MKLHELVSPPGSRRRKRRVGRGHGSGRVKTAGKGTKGQNSRSGGGVKPFFEGGQNPWTMKIPHKRGFNRGRFRVETQVVNVKDLEKLFNTGDTVDLAALKKRGLIDDTTGKKPVKLLGEGTLSKSLTIEVHRASAGAQSAVREAGGSLTLLMQPEPAPEEAEAAADSDAAPTGESTDDASR
ncbi:MAG TPA: 50S ribosomal protein L15 [Chloroflexota bacterium]|nr:50S ribosomal protein L15 [Chloroflexota bacterium]